MTYQVALSRLKDKAEFQAAVDTHIARLKAFSFEKGTPRPTHHPLVESCIRRIQRKNQPDDFVADYEIVDDVADEYTKMSLEQKKIVLHHRVEQAANEAKFKFLPRGKYKLFAFDLVRAQATKEDKRTESQKAIIQRNEERLKVFEKIDEIEAHALSDIEDLTEQTIGSWQPPEFTW